MPDNRPEEVPTREEPGTAIPPESTDGQNQDAPRGHDRKTFLEYARESMEEHETLVRLHAQ